MRVLMINSVCGIGSTGRICADIAQKMEQEGHEVKIAYGRSDEVPEQFQKYAVRIGDQIDMKWHGLRTRILDQHGFGSKQATKRFLKWAERFDPELLWLHNLHGYYINVEMLFDWIKSRPNMKVKWTLHDCWAFTGHCSHFAFVGCDKWKTGCHMCSQKRNYPASLICDNSRDNYSRKKAAFCGVKDMTIITPSHWLANHVKSSFLREYPVEVVYNEIDHRKFKPTPSNFREKYGLEKTKIVLGVASTWNERKGLNDFIQLSEMLPEEYKIVLVGLSAEQIKKLPENILGIQRTNSVTELAELYTAADIFVNASREETFGLTTVEARACGTEAIVYEGTACEEVTGIFGGIVAPIGVMNLYSAIIDYFKVRDKQN